MMDAKLRKAIEAALDAGDAMFNEIGDPTMNILDQWAFIQKQHKAIKAARRELANQDESRG